MKFVNNDISPRGVYYNLELSPYEYTDDLGNVYKFSSMKKLTMFENKVKMKKQAFDIEIEKLKTLGYDISNEYRTNIIQIPKNVYNQMIYK